MPIHEYRCCQCGFPFQELITTDRDQKENQCPECGSKQVKKLISAPGYVNGGYYDKRTEK